MFTLFSGRHVDHEIAYVPTTRRLLRKEHRQHGDSILGSVNLRKTFQRISEVWEHAETQNLEKCLLNLSPQKLQFLDFIP